MLCFARQYLQVLIESAHLGQLCKSLNFFIRRIESESDYTTAANHVAFHNCYLKVMKTFLCDVDMLETS